MAKQRTAQPYEDLRDCVIEELRRFNDGKTYDSVHTSFMMWIANTIPSSRFVTPSFTLEDGNSDLWEHVMFYHNAIHTFGIPEDKREVILCKMFATSLTGPALNWFYGFKKGSVTFFRQF